MDRSLLNLDSENFINKCISNSKKLEHIEEGFREVYEFVKNYFKGNYDRKIYFRKKYVEALEKFANIKKDSGESEKGEELSNKIKEQLELFNNKSELLDEFLKFEFS